MTMPKLKAYSVAVSTIFAGSLLAHAAGDGDDLLLSDEIVPWEELGKDFIKRPTPVTEMIEDLIFKQNRERAEIIERSHETGDPSLLDDVPERKSIFGGNPFLGSGEIFEGIEIPTGAVWQPVFILYGGFRSAVQTRDAGFGATSEWVNRLDLNGNLYLTQTERIFFSIRPLDDEGEFTGYQFEGDDEGGFETFNARIRSLFFEGDFGELFPKLDPYDRHNYDYGMAFGRQPLNFQDGILLNDSIDSFGISRASLFGLGSTAMRITALAGGNEVHRGNNVRDEDAFIYGIFTSMDYRQTSLDIDFVYVDGSSESGGDGIYAGIGDIRRIGTWSSTTRLNGSWALDEETAAIGTGGLLTSQLNRTMTFNDDLFYVDTFVGVGDYTSAARDPSTGGPLGTIGILYRTPGLGDFAPALGNRVGESVGGAVGYQHFFDNRQASVIAELGGRVSISGDEMEDSVAFGLLFQKAMGQHSILRLDAHVAYIDDPANPGRDDFGYGARAEWRVKF
jgi:hypothetical protein